MAAIRRAAGQPLNEMSILGWASRFMNAKTLTEYLHNLHDFHVGSTYVHRGAARRAGAHCGR